MDAFEDPELERLIDGVGERLGYAVGGARHRAARRLPGLRRATDGSRTASLQDPGAGTVLSADSPCSAVVVPRRSLTRRQALRAGALAAAAGALRPSARARRAARGAVRARPSTASRRAPRPPAAGGWRDDAGCCARRAASTWSACAGRAARAPRRRCAPAAAAGAGRGWVTLHAAATTGRTTARAPAGTDPAFIGAADEFQLRLRGDPARPARPLRARAADRARSARRLAPRGSRRRRARAAAAAGQPAGDHPAQRVGRRLPCPPRAAPVYGEVQVAFVHHTVTANDYGPEDSAGDRARHRPLPPQQQRLERHRLQLPRRQVRPGLRGPRGRDRPGRRRRAGAGLEQRLDRHRLPRELHDDRPDARRAWTRWRA